MLQMERWTDKIAVVTGASAGIGWATTCALIEAGMQVVGLARRHARMLELADAKFTDSLQRKRFHARQCDLNDLTSIQNAFEWIKTEFGGHVHVLINNAGMAIKSQLLDAGNELALQRVIDVNLMGTVHCTKQAFPLMVCAMRETGAACHVINVNSLLGHTVPPQIPASGFNLYPVAKHALRALNEVLRREFAPHKKLLRLSNISPGLTYTEFGTNDAFPPFEFDGQLLSPEDVARGICFILGSPQHINVAELLMLPSCEEY